jgi:hypothetical protein
VAMEAAFEEPATLTAPVPPSAVVTEVVTALPVVLAHAARSGLSSPSSAVRRLRRWPLVTIMATPTTGNSPSLAYHAIDYFHDRLRRLSLLRCYHASALRQISPGRAGGGHVTCLEIPLAHLLHGGARRSP